MRTGSKAWEGVGIVVMGRTPILPARIEVQIEETFPNDAVRVKSFEDYDQALAHCREEKNVGCFILIDDQKTPGSAEIFRNLAEPYRSTGWPAFGTVLYDKVKSLQGVEQLIADRRLFSYQPIDDFADATSCQRSMFHLWDKFVEATEATLFAERFRESILSCAGAVLPEGSLHFYDRTYNLLSSNLNLGWRDRICLRWAMAVKSAEKHDKEMMSPHEDIKSLFQIFSDVHSNTAAEAVNVCGDKSLNLAIRFYNLLSFLDHARVQGTLKSSLNEIGSAAGPGASALVKALKQAINSIIQFEYQGRATG